MKATQTVDYGGIYLNEEIVEALAKEMSEEIDWECLKGLLLESGWKEIKMDWPKSINSARAHEIKEWCRAHLKGHYNGRGGSWIFEDERDATLFVLRWA